MPSDELTGRIIAAAIEVHRHLGPGLLEAVYEECLCHELSLMGLRFERQPQIPVTYKGHRLQSGYRADLIVEGEVVVEVKATEGTARVYHAQLLTYLKVSNKPRGLLINFNVPVLKDGVKRIVNRYADLASPRLGVSVVNRRPH
ncbi:MAG: GxxExxY protein [Acidobacteria bacterium]|nr:GxxExxY protein [Acidobacteriota bacterium]